jgi:hypothetical protein
MPPSTEVDPNGEPGPGPGAGADAPQDTLAIVALALGIAALAMSAIPFYGMGFAVPLGIVALVLGITSRRRRDAGRGMATAGAVTGGLALVVVAVWFLVMFVPLWGFRTDTPVRTSAESVSVSAPADERTVEPPEGRAEADGGEPRADAPPPIETEPDTPPPPGGQLDGSGEARIQVDDEGHLLELETCSLADEHTIDVRGDGTDGRFGIRVGTVHGGELDVVLALDVENGPARTLTATQTGTSYRERSTMFDRRRVEVTGTMRDLLDDQEVVVELLVTCR